LLLLKDEDKFNGVSEDKSEICQVLEKGDEDVEETLTQLGVHLSPGLVLMVLGKTSSPTSALRFFQWAKTQPGFKHNSSTYDKLGNTVGSSKDFETLQRVLWERFVEGGKISFKTFSFVTAWHDDPAMLNEVLEMIKKLELSPRRYAYERLIGALCRKDHVDAALAVLEKIATADCAPRMHAYRPLIQVYCKKNQMDKAQEVFGMMKDCPQDSSCYNLVLSALCSRKQFAKATKFFQSMVNMGYKPDAIAYDIMICAACETGRIQGALQLFDRLKEEGIKPLYGTYTHLLRGLLQNNGFDKAHSFLIQQSGKDPKLDSVNYTYLIRKCRKSGQKEEADKLLMEKEAKGFAASG
jgi:leucine-rich PPR motif-containing protein